MTTSTKTTPNPFDLDLEANLTRVRTLNEKLLTAAKQGGHLGLDAYEKSVASLVDVEHRLAQASQLDWVSTLTTTHTTFVTELSGAYLKAARDALK